MSYTSGTNYRSIKTYSGGRGIVSRMRSNSMGINQGNVNNSQNKPTNGTGNSNATTATLRAELRTYSRISKESTDGIQKSGEKLTEVGENSLFGKAEKTENNKQVVSEATDFINNYNSMLSSITKLGGAENKKYITELKAFADKNAEDLKSIGVTVLKDGSLTMNKKELEGASLENLKKVFNGEDSFAGNITKLSEGIEKNVEAKLKENMMILGGNISGGRTNNNTYDRGGYYNRRV